MTKQRKNSRRLRVRRIDPRSATYIASLVLLIVAPLLMPSIHATLSDVVLIIVLANTIAYTLVGTATVFIRLLRRYSEQLAFQFAGYLLLLAMAAYSYYDTIQKLQKP
ncbi:MAG: hypothetical protein J7L12_00645 [Desulfurococcales archaeon]|nr:hypothetical protein [Desulfurococcales archaeon]